MHKQFFADVLARRPALWQRLLQANLPEGGPRLPDDCREQLGGAADSLWAWLQQRPLTHGPTAAESEPAVQVPFWDYAEESRRLALLDAPALLELCRVTGVVLHAPAIATVLLRDEVLPLRESLGEETYQYALQRGRSFSSGGIRICPWRNAVPCTAIWRCVWWPGFGRKMWPCASAIVCPRCRRRPCCRL